MLLRFFGRFGELSFVAAADRRAKCLRCATVLTTGLTGCTSIKGRLEVFRAVGLGVGSGRSKGSSAGFSTGSNAAWPAGLGVSKPGKTQNNCGY